MAYQPQPIQLTDLSKQRLLIGPDDPLPKFHPRPKAVMVIPIYHDHDLGQDTKLTHHTNKSGKRSSSRLGAILAPFTNSTTTTRKPRGKLFRRYSSYSPPPVATRHTRDRSSSRHASRDPERGRSRTRFAADNTYYGTRGDRERLPNDPIAMNTPAYQLQATQSHGQGPYPAHSTPFYPPSAGGPLGSPYPGQPLSSGVQNGGTLSAYGMEPHHRHHGRSRSRYSRSRGDRERPPNDPLAQNPPNYQIQASQGGGAPMGGGIAPSQGAMGHQYSPQQSSLYIPPGQPLPSGNVQHGGGTQYASSMGASPSHQQAHGLYSGHSGSHQHHGGHSHAVPMAQSASGSQYGGVPTGQGGSMLANALHSIPVIGGMLQDPHGVHDSHLLEEAVQNYFKVLPPNPQWRASRLRGAKKAVCIGINYLGQRSELKGCANDARSVRDFLIRNYGFQPSNVLLLTDDDRNNILPTRKEIFKSFMWLVNGARRDDSLFFHYSGHGGQSEDAGGREADNMDETIFPMDHEQAGDIIDDELYQALVQPLPPGCRLTAIFDSCHSGTVLDLPYIHSAHGRLRGIKHVSRRAIQRGVAPSGDVICFSACKDDETSADTFKGGVAVGAMSHALIQSLANNLNQTYDELLLHLREILVPKYHQKAQISCARPLDLKQKFSV